MNLLPETITERGLFFTETLWLQTNQIIDSEVTLGVRTLKREHLVEQTTETKFPLRKCVNANHRFPPFPCSLCTTCQK
jgi:hypothetical protein